MICKRCGQEANEQMHHSCPHCGNPLGDGIYMPPDGYLYDSKRDCYYQEQQQNGMVYITRFNAYDGSYEQETMVISAASQATPRFEIPPGFTPDSSGKYRMETQNLEKGLCVITEFNPVTGQYTQTTVPMEGYPKHQEIPKSNQKSRSHKKGLEGALFALVLIVALGAVWYFNLYQKLPFASALSFIPTSAEVFGKGEEKKPPVEQVPKDTLPPDAPSVAESDSTTNSETSTDKSETPTNKSEAPTDKSEAPTDKSETPASSKPPVAQEPLTKPDNLEVVIYPAAANKAVIQIKGLGIQESYPGALAGFEDTTAIYQWTVAFGNYWAGIIETGNGRSTDSVCMLSEMQCSVFERNGNHSTIPEGGNIYFGMNKNIDLLEYYVILPENATFNFLTDSGYVFNCTYGDQNYSFDGPILQPYEAYNLKLAAGEFYIEEIYVDAYGG